MKTKTLTILILFLSAQIITAQELYLGQKYADILKTVHTYSSPLKLDFYTAKEAKENNDRPLIVFMHGGGFSGGQRDNPLETKFAQTMAAKGYAVASISYTLTRKGKSTGFGCDCPNTVKMETFELLVNDLLDAVNFMKGDSDFHFDSDKIVLAGSSAGAEIALNAAYLASHPDFKELPYGRTKFAAVVSLAGAVVDARYISANNAVPAFLVHGKKDNLVPYATAPHHYCDPTKPGFLMLDGSKTIADRLAALNASHYLMTDEEGNHDWANLGFKYTDEIAQFLKTTVVDGEKVQEMVAVRQ